MIPITIQVPDQDAEKYRRVFEFLAKEGEFGEMWNGETVLHWRDGKFKGATIAPKITKSIRLTEKAARAYN